MSYSLNCKRIFVAGHRGMVGSALVRRLASEGCQVVTAGRDVLDLTDQAAVRDWFNTEKPDAVILAAAKVGGIHANDTYPVDFLADNLAMQTNVITSAHESGVEKLLFLGSSCIYPKHAPQPIPEEALLTGPLEPTNEWYAIAKIAGIKLCQAYRKQYGADFISAQPTNLYGPGDNYDLENSHVLPALLRKFHEAKEAGSEEVVVWGSGKPMREFLHVDDMAAASLFVMELDKATYARETEPMLSHINVGSGTDVTIRELAETVARVTGFEGKLSFDTTKPDGAPRKLMDVSRLARLGWTASIGLEEGIRGTYAWFLAQSPDALRAK